MKNHMLRTIILTVILVFVAISLASAGAVHKHHRDGGGDRSSQPSSKSTDDRSSRDDGSRNDRNTNDSHSGRQGGSDRQGGDSKSSDSHSDRTMHDRQPDSGPTNRDSNRDSGRSDSNSHQDHHANRDDHYFGGYGRSDDGKISRVDERPRYFSRERYHSAPPVSYRQPRFSAGYYHYTSGYPFYYDYELCFGGWQFKYVPDHCYRSVYYYYGYFPYIPMDRVIVVSHPAVVYVEIPLGTKGKHSYYEDDNYSNYGINGILSDITKAWEQNDPGLLLKHTGDDVRIDVILDKGDLYSVNAEDYRAMTKDAIEHTETISFAFDSVRSRGDDKIVAYGRHTFYSPDGGTKSVYISYEFVKRGGAWVIDQAGSSLDPLDQ